MTMLIPFPSNRPGRKRSQAEPSMASRLEAEAEAARDAGDFERAVACYQAALELSPLNRELREALAETLWEQADRRASHRNGPKPQATSRVLIPVEDIPAPEPEPRPQPAPKRRRRPATGATAVPGMNALDKEDASRRMLREMRAKKPAREEEAAPAPPRPRRAARRRGFSPRALVLGALFTGILLIGVGLAHGVIVRLLGPAALPEAPVEPPLPAELSSLLDNATAELGRANPEKALKLLEGAEFRFIGHSKAVQLARASALRSLGSRLLDQRDYAKAAEAYAEAADLAPGNASNWVELGRAYREHARANQVRNAKGSSDLFAKAIDAYRKALNSDTARPAALLGLGQVHAFINDRTEAVRYYREVLEAAPDSPEARLARQQLEQLKGNA